MTTRTCSSPEAFKQALEQRLRSATKTGAEFARRRQLLVFDRFLAHVEVVQIFLNPVLAGTGTRWRTEAWAWSSAQEDES